MKDSATLKSLPLLVRGHILYKYKMLGVSIEQKYLEQ